MTIPDTTCGRPSLPGATPTARQSRIRGVHLSMLLAIGTLILAPFASAQTVSMAGSIGDAKALLMINGAPHTLAVGSSVKGVTLKRVMPGQAEVEIAGKTLHGGDGRRAGQRGRWRRWQQCQRARDPDRRRPRRPLRYQRPDQRQGGAVHGRHRRHLGGDGDRRSRAAGHRLEERPARRQPDRRRCGGHLRGVVDLGAHRRRRGVWCQRDDAAGRDAFRAARQLVPGPLFDAPRLQRDAAREARLSLPPRGLACLGSGPAAGRPR